MQALERAGHRAVSNILEISDDLQAWANSIEFATTDEELAEIEGCVIDFLAQLGDRVDDFVNALHILQGQAEIGKQAVDRIQARVRVIENAEKRLREFAVKAIEMMGAKKLEGNTSRISLRACPASVAIVNQNAIPAEFVHVDIRCRRDQLDNFVDVLTNGQLSLWHKMVSVQSANVDKRAIADAIKAGRDVPGADLAIGKQSLMVK